MTDRILKYKIPHHGRNTISMPSTARVLSFSCQNDGLVMWAIAPMGAAVVDRAFDIIYTGEPIEVELGRSKAYIGTTQFGGLVYHLFEVVECF